METALDGKIVLLTGASGGIGRAAARLFAAEGARVVLAHRTQTAAAEELAAELGDRGLALAADLRDEEETEALFADTLKAWKRIDLLVVNAGIWIEDDVPLYEMGVEQWRSTLAANLDSAFFCCRAYLQHLAAVHRESASIVLVGSTAALYGEEGHADYSASKAALTGLTLTLKNEIVRLAPRGRVNCVAPGWVDTPMSAHAIENPAAVERAFSTMALRKLASAEDVAQAIVFLSSERLAGHLSGAVLPVAGGMEGRRLHG